MRGNGWRRCSSITRFGGSFPAVCCFSLFRQSGRRTVHRFWLPTFKRCRIFRLGDPESVRYRQVLIAGVRRTRREREQLRDREISEGRLLFTTLGREYERLAELPDLCEDPYAVPPTGPATLTFKGLPLDELEDLIPTSLASTSGGKNSRAGAHCNRRKASYTVARRPSWLGRVFRSHQRHLWLRRRTSHRRMEEQKGHDEIHGRRSRRDNHHPRAGALCPGTLRRVRYRGDGHA